MQATSDRVKHDPFRSLDRSIASLLGVDIRLIYGMAVPMLLVIGVIIAFALSPSWVFLGILMIVEIACLGLVITKIVAILNSPEE